jgi:hypothetical protein
VHIDVKYAASGLSSSPYATCDQVLTIVGAEA